MQVRQGLPSLNHIVQTYYTLQVPLVIEGQKQFTYPHRVSECQSDKKIHRVSQTFVSLESSKLLSFIVEIKRHVNIKTSSCYFIPTWPPTLLIEYPKFFSRQVSSDYRRERSKIFQQHYKSYIDSDDCHQLVLLLYNNSSLSMRQGGPLLQELRFANQS